MPESVTDRPTKAHETIFLLSKRPDYYFDAEAVREPHISDGRGGFSNKATCKYTAAIMPNGKPGSSMVNASVNPDGRNIRSVWSIPSEAFPGAHFATYPRKLIEPCIKAGSSQHGCCPRCGAPWERVVEREGKEKPITFTPKSAAMNGYGGRGDRTSGLNEPGWRKRAQASSQHLGWRPTCTCPPATPVPCTVFDPFVGSGTTIVVANALGRRAIGCDLSAEYLRMAQRRIDRPHAKHTTPGPAEPLPLFDRLSDEL